MNSKYDINAKIFKALGDPNRLRIIDMLSCGEKCACELLEYFDFTQPTLSHHMKVLIECNLVRSRKLGTWNYYRLDINNANKLALFLMNTITDTDDCICRESNSCCGK
ncbi:MAG: metalloregulator ArsR/SmtB family transcription factor [Clostridium sp.]